MKDCGCTESKRRSNAILMKKCGQYLQHLHYFIQLLYMRHVTWGLKAGIVQRSDTVSARCDRLLATVLSRSVGRVNFCWPSPASEVHILKLVLSRSIGYTAAGLRQHSQSWLRAPTFLFFPRRLSVLKWGFLFYNRMGRETTGHSPSYGGEPQAGTHSLTDPLHAHTHTHSNSSPEQRTVSLHIGFRFGPQRKQCLPQFLLYVYLLNCC
jgi:hypothetical protein